MKVVNDTAGEIGDKVEDAGVKVGDKASLVRPTSVVGIAFFAFFALIYL